MCNVYLQTNLSIAMLKVININNARCYSTITGRQRIKTARHDLCMFIGTFSLFLLKYSDNIKGFAHFLNTTFKEH